MVGDMSGQAGPSGQAPKVNNHQKTSERMCEDESELKILILCSLLQSYFFFYSELGDMSTISAVLYANQNHPELKIEYPHWPDRYKQIMKKWRALSADKKQPYLQRARDNRSTQQAQLRTKKAQQVREFKFNSLLSLHYFSKYFLLKFSFRKIKLTHYTYVLIHT